MEEIVVPPYSKQVLIGNWMDRRYSFDEKSNGILPGLSLSDQCEKHRSLSQDTYEPYYGKDTNQDFLEKRITRVRNFYTGTTSNVKLLDATELNNNYTTTNTLVYEWLPRIREELRARKMQSTEGIPKPLPIPDMLQSFGNLTQTRNYAKHFKCEKLLNDLNRMRTTYDSAYNRNQNIKGLAKGVR